MTDTPDTEYWTTQDIADYCGIKRSSVNERLSRRTMPQPDLVWLGKNLWRPETIKTWRGRKAGRQQGKRLAKRVKATQKIRPESTRIGSPPRVKRAASRNGASPTPPQASPVSETTAKEIAAALRSDGYYATTLDVMELAGSPGEPDHERDLLRQRVQAKVRGMKARNL